MTAPLCVNPRCRKPLRKRTDRPGWAHIEGYCVPCGCRWNYAGRPSSGVPDAMARDQYASLGGQANAARRQEKHIARLLAFARLRARGVPVEAAARRVGVAPSTARGYEAELKRSARAAA